MLYTSNKVYEFPNFAKKPLQNLRMECQSTFQRMKILMASFQVCDAMSILFKFEKPPIEHLEGFILLPKETVNCKFFLKLLTGNFNSRTWNNSPTKSVKVGASMVGGMFTIATMNCWGEKFIEVGTRSGLLGIIPWCVMAACSAIWKVLAMVVA